MNGKYNSFKLCSELRAAGITTHGNCNSIGVVWDDDNNEIQDRPDVAAILEAHDPTPDPEPKTDREVIAELQAQVAVLSKAADTSKLSIEEMATLNGGMGMVEETL